MDGLILVSSGKEDLHRKERVSELSPLSTLYSGRLYFVSNEHSWS